MCVHRCSQEWFPTGKITSLKKEKLGREKFQAGFGKQSDQELCVGGLVRRPPPGRRPSAWPEGWRCSPRRRRSLASTEPLPSLRFSAGSEHWVSRGGVSQGCHHLTAPNLALKCPALSCQVSSGLFSKLKLELKANKQTKTAHCNYLRYC